MSRKNALTNVKISVKISVISMVPTRGIPNPLEKLKRLNKPLKGTTYPSEIENEKNNGLQLIPSRVQPIPF